MSAAGRQKRKFVHLCAERVDLILHFLRKKPTSKQQTFLIFVNFFELVLCFCSLTSLGARPPRTACLWLAALALLSMTASLRFSSTVGRHRFRCVGCRSPVDCSWKPFIRFSPDVRGLKSGSALDALGLTSKVVPDSPPFMKKSFWSKGTKKNFSLMDTIKSNKKIHFYSWK